MKKSIIVILNIIILTSIFIDRLYSSDYKGYSDWLLQPESARGAAMGRALVAIVDNANTVFWNPGGAAFLKGVNFTFHYDTYKDKKNVFVDIDSKLPYLSFAMKLKENFL